MTREEHLAAIVEACGDAISAVDLDGTITVWNGAAARLYGYAADEALGHKIDLVIPPERRGEVEAVLAELREQPRVVQRETRRRRKDGALLDVAVTISPILEPGGRLVGASAVVREVVERRRADDARALLAAIVESSQDAIFSRSRDGTVLSWNRGAERMYGYSAAEVVGDSVMTLVPAGRTDEMAMLMRHVLHGQSVEAFETVHRRKDGTVIDVALSLSALRDPHGAIVGASIIARDLTPERRAEATLRRTEEQLRQIQKMEAIGNLAGGVAHDFNNMLSVILSYSEFLLGELRDGDPMRDEIQEIKRAAERSAELTRQLLAFSRKQVLQPAILDLNEIVRGLQKMLVRLIGEQIDLSVTLAAAPWQVAVDRGQIEQVIMNLVVNARDAMPAGGMLTIETANVVLDEEYAAEHVGVAPGPYALLAVSDSGVGIDDEVREHMFEPFFTTKGEGGTGLGLATVFGIVKQSGGHIWVYSELGRGSSFKVYLPQADPRTRISAAAAPVPLTLRGNETILVAEDDAQVRTLVRTLLARNGYNVLSATNAGEALLLCEQYPAQIHMLLTDVIMPRMTGPQLAERLLALRPDLRVLYVSGYTDSAVVHHGVLDPGVAFLAKPLTPDALLRKVREVLGAPR